MNLYLISQSVNNHHDTYDSAVVRAPTESTARTIHPNGCNVVSEDTAVRFNQWCKLSSVRSKLIGKAAEGSEQGVVCASFNAG